MGEITQTANDHCLILTLEYHILNLLQTAISLNNDIIENIARDIYMNNVSNIAFTIFLRIHYLWIALEQKQYFHFGKNIYALVDSTDEVIKALNTFINVR